MKIMVVDDEKDIKMLFEQRFRREIKQGKLAFLFAFSGEEACDYLKSNGSKEVNQILSDINMPGMNGLELLLPKKSHRLSRSLAFTLLGNDI